MLERAGILGRVEIVPLYDWSARTAGTLWGIAGTTDVIDASVVASARERGHGVMTCA